MIKENLKYAGFWIRLGAALIDSFLMLLIVVPFIFIFFSPEAIRSNNLFNGSTDFIFNYLLPATITIAFWVYKAGTPGELLLDLKY